MVFCHVFLQSNRAHVEKQQEMTSSISSLKKQVAEREANTADLAKQLNGRGDVVDKLRAELAWAKSQLECLELLKHELELKNNEKTELSDKVAKLQVPNEFTVFFLFPKKTASHLI